MIQSRKFWIGTILLAIIPLLLIDIAEHSMNWQKEVREEIITVVHNLYSFNKQQKTEILDRVLDRNQTLTFLIYIKSFITVILLVLTLYFFNLYRKEKYSFWKSLISLIVVVGCFLSIKIFLIHQLSGKAGVKILSIAPNENSFKNLFNEKFKGKVVYVDFWGTTCGPCLQEFRNFTKPIKEKYKSRKDISYLYIAQGNKYLWKQQIDKYNIEGNHIFLDDKQYEILYRQSITDSKALITMPRYLIVDKEGNIVITDAKRPSDGSGLFAQLDKYLLTRD